MFNVIEMNKDIMKIKKKNIIKDYNEDDKEEGDSMYDSGDTGSAPLSAVIKEPKEEKPKKKKFTDKIIGQVEKKLSEIESIVGNKKQIKNKGDLDRIMTCAYNIDYLVNKDKDIKDLTTRIAQSAHTNKRKPDEDNIKIIKLCTKKIRKQIK